MTINIGGAQETWASFWLNPTTAFNGVLTFLTFVLVVVAIRQIESIRVAKETLKAAQEASRNQLKAYVHVESVHVVWSESGEVAFDVKCKNTGQTPAVFFEVGAQAASLSIKDDGRSVVPADLPYKRWTPIGADSERIARCHPANPETLRLVSFIKPSKNLFALGRVRYGDIFGDVWETEFSAFVRWPRGERTSMTFANAALQAYSKAAVSRLPVSTLSEE